MDELGRVVPPVEMCRALGICRGDMVEFCAIDGGIGIKPHQIGCDCCGRIEETVTVNGVTLCLGCIEMFQAEAAREEV